MNLKTCSQLLKYDSIFGVLNADIDLLDDGISIDGKKFFFSEMSRVILNGQMKNVT